MIVVVDTNILFGALIAPNGRLAHLLAKPDLPVTRITCHFLLAELFKHQPKIVQNSKRPMDDITDDLLYYLKVIRLDDETFIAPEHWLEADRLTKGVDSKDITFVALALQTDGILWTGDKKLTEHLKAMGFDRVVTTAELSALLNIE